MSDVISINAKTKSKDLEKEEEKDEAVLSFDEVMEKNRRTKEKMEKERNKANRSVLRSYRLKT